MFPMPLVSPSLLKLRVSRKELLQGRMHIPFMPLCATVIMKVTGNTRHFLFPTIDQNPFLPQAPGKPGLLYRANDAKKWRDGVQAVFVQRRSAVYEYVGEYELTRAPSLSVVEYMTWPSKVGRCTPHHGTWMLMLRGSGEDGVGGCHLRQGKIYGHTITDPEFERQKSTPRCVTNNSPPSIPIILKLRRTILHMYSYHRTDFENV